MNYHHNCGRERGNAVTLLLWSFCLISLSRHYKGCQTLVSLITLWAWAKKLLQLWAERVHSYKLYEKLIGALVKYSTHKLQSAGQLKSWHTLCRGQDFRITEVLISPDAAGNLGETRKLEFFRLALLCMLTKGWRSHLNLTDNSPKPVNSYWASPDHAE